MKRLPSKILFIATLLIASVLAAYPIEDRIRLGTDLRGGVSLIYHVQIPEGGNAQQILLQTINVLQDRINPQGIFDIRFQPQGRDRIEIVMPLPNDRVKAAKAAYEAALVDLQDRAMIEDFELDQALAEGIAAERWGSAGDQTTRINELQQTFNQMSRLRLRYQALRSDPDRDAAELSRVENELAEVELDFDDQRQEVLRRSINRNEVVRALRMSTDQPKVRNEAGESVTGQSPRDIALAELQRTYPHVTAEINEVVRLYEAYASMRTGFDDPDDLKRLLRGAGLLEFRVAVLNSEAGVFDFARLRQQLVERGPRNVDAPNVAWFPINDLKQWTDDKEDELLALRTDPIGFFASGRNLVAAEHQGEYYLLLYTSEDKSITHDRGVKWAVRGTSIQPDNFGRDSVGFELDTAGGQLMRRMTSQNVEKPMAIVLDGQVYSAPSIREAIGSRGNISGNFSRAELNYLIRTLAAGALSAQLSPNPIAENTIGPSLGRDNLEKGLYACLYGVIAITFIMLVYYFFAGGVACIALICNGILIFGVMALQQSTFTLPGIAGIILTIAMAVDANILIYERIREEMFGNKDIDLRTAIRLGYSKALSTILDANITNLIVCFVLYNTATTEVKGFALTLTIGIFSTLFTALFVTRVIFTIYTDVLKREAFPMLPTVFPAIHRALEPNIDWVGLRKYFIPFSLILVTLCITAVLMRGVDLLDTEFRGGTSVTFTTRTDEGTGRNILLTRAEVESRVRAIAESQADPVLQQFRSAGIVTLGDIQEDGSASTFQVKVSLPPGFDDSEDTTAGTVLTEKIVSAVVAAFRAELDLAQQVQFTNMDLATNPSATRPITESVLGRVIDRAGFEQRITPFVGGVAVMIEGIQPPITTEDLADRIDRLRQQPDFSRYAGRSVQIFGLDPGSTRSTYTSMAVLVRDEGVNYFTSREDVWEQELAQTEWRIVSEALRSASPLDQVSSFSAAVAQSLFASAAVAVLLSLFGILAYIWIRFGSLRYSMGAVIGLVHDVIIALGLLAITAWLARIPFINALGVDDFRIDMGVIAGLLTVIGYSLNDTLVILDRIRENRGKRIITSAAIINNSINQTFSRTILTSGSTIVAVVIMFAVGGTGIRPFAFCLLMGLLIGPYSSVAIAAPLVYDKRLSNPDPSKDEPDEETALVPVAT